MAKKVGCCHGNLGRLTSIVFKHHLLNTNQKQHLFRCFSSQLLPSSFTDITCRLSDCGILVIEDMHWLAIVDGQKVNGEQSCSCTYSYISKLYAINCFNMLRCQCRIWGCSNKIGRGPEDMEGRRHCKCSELCSKDFLELSAMLSLHSVGKMPKTTTRSSCRI